MQYTFLTLDEENGGLDTFVEYDFDGVIIQRQIHFDVKPDDIEMAFNTLGNQMIGVLV